MCPINDICIITLQSYTINDINSFTVKHLNSFFSLKQVRDPQNRPLDDEALPRTALIHRRGSGKYQYLRAITKRFEFPPGYFVIIPSTFHPHEESEFLLRIYTEKEVESEWV